MDDDTDELDRSVEMAWIRFQRKLGDRLAQLEVGQRTRLILPPGEDDTAGPAITCEALPDGTITATLPREAVAPIGSVDSLVDSGWARSDTAGGLRLTLAQDRVDQLAHLIVHALRDELGLPHPVFVATDFIDSAAPQAEGPAETPYEPPEIDLLAPVMPNSHEDLIQVVDDTLSVYLGRHVVHDDDGDFPMVHGSVVVFVRALGVAPVVELFCPLIRDVEDLEHAGIEVSILNRRSQFISYYLDGTTVMAKAHIPAFPFVPQHLLGVLTKMSETLDDLDDDLMLRVSGRLWLDRPETDAAVVEEATEDDEDELVDEDAEGTDQDTDELPPQLQALLQYDAEGTAEVAPAVVARLFDNDLDLLVACLRLSEQETISWRQAMDEALEAHDQDEADACVHEMRAWEKTVSDLRAGLRFVVNQLTQDEWGK